MHENFVRCLPDMKTNMFFTKAKKSSQANVKPSITLLFDMQQEKILSAVKDLKRISYSQTNSVYVSNSLTSKLTYRRIETVDAFVLENFVTSSRHIGT